MNIAKYYSNTCNITLLPNTCGLVPSQNYTQLSKYSILQCLHWQLNLSLMQTQSQMIYLKRINNEYGKLGAAAGFGFYTTDFCKKLSIIIQQFGVIAEDPIVKHEAEMHC